MKFELEPDNRNCPEEALIADLRDVAERLRKASVTQDEYNGQGRFSPATIKKRFGTWNRALGLAGLKVKKRINIGKSELLEDLKKAAREHQTQVLTVAQYKVTGSFSHATIACAFGSWEDAISAAGLKVSDSWRPKIENERLFSNLAEVFERLGRQPKQGDLRPPISEFSSSVYKRRFGSWRKALESFVEFANANELPETQVQAPLQGPNQETNRQPKSAPRKTPRDPSWRLRFLVNRRDRFACRACGRSPANEVGVVLHVDHILPWSKGGETTMENLQTLCEVCNLGKSDLPMHEAES